MAEQKQNETASPKEAKGEARPKESLIFGNIFRQYADSIVSLRDFFSRLSPLVVEIGKGIVKEREAYLDEIFNDFKRDTKPEDIQELENFMEATRAITGKSSHDAKSVSIDIKSPLVNQYLLKMLKLFSHYTPEDIHHELVNRSILMSLVSYFEVLVADLAHAFYRIAPDAISTNDKVLSVNELKQFGSIDEALRSIISDRVDKLLRGPVNDWQEFFQSRMKINMKLLVPDWAQWEEYFQRRHIMIHAGGRVTERYLSNIDWEGLKPYMTKPSLDDKLNIEDTYLDHAIDAFEVSGLLLCQEVWRKLVPGDSKRRHDSLTGLTDAVYRRLLSRHWYVAERLAAWGERDSEAPEDSRLTCKFNRCLSIKRQRRWNEVEEEVKAFDCSAKHPKYAIARASLLEQVDAFLKLLPAARGAGIEIADLKEWPIFEEMRKDPRFAKVIAEAEQKAQNGKGSQ